MIPAGRDSWPASEYASVTDFAVAGDYLAVLHGKRLTTYNIADPKAPRQTAERTLEAPGRALAADGRQLFAALGPRGLAAFQLQADGRLAARGRYPTTAAAVDVAVDDGLAYVALGERGVVIVDATDPSHLHWRGSYHRLGRVERLRVAGDRLYAANEASRVYLLNVRRPARPSIAAARRFAGPVRDVAVAGRGRAWVLTADGPGPHGLFRTGAGVLQRELRRGGGRQLRRHPPRGHPGQRGLHRRLVLGHPPVRHQGPDAPAPAVQPAHPRLGQGHRGQGRLRLRRRRRPRPAGGGHQRPVPAHRRGAGGHPRPGLYPVPGRQPPVSGQPRGRLPDHRCQ